MHWAVMLLRPVVVLMWVRVTMRVAMGVAVWVVTMLKARWQWC